MRIATGGPSGGPYTTSDLTSQARQPHRLGVPKTKVVAYRIISAVNSGSPGARRGHESMPRNSNGAEDEAGPPRRPPALRNRSRDVRPPIPDQARSGRVTAELIYRKDARAFLCAIDEGAIGAGAPGHKSAER